MEDEAQYANHVDRTPDRRSRRNTQRLLVLAAVLAIAVAIVVVVAFNGDEDEDPESDASGVPTQVAGLAQNIPPPESCQVAPRSVTEMQSLVATPAASPVSEPIVATPAPSNGTPADPAVIEEIVATYQEAVACQNAGDFARTYALYSDDVVRRILAGASAQLNVDPALVAVVIGTPTTLPPMEWTAIVARGAIQMLPDGRASAVFVTVTVQEASSQDAARPRLVYFVNEDGRWVIDGTLDPTAQASPAASPAP